MSVQRVTPKNGPPNKEMQQTSRGPYGGSLLISVLGRRRVHLQRLTKSETAEARRTADPAASAAGSAVR